MGGTTSEPRLHQTVVPAAPETKFRTAPDGVMAYANYLAAAGLIKVKPASWSELFVPQLQSRTGS